MRCSTTREKLFRLKKSQAAIIFWWNWPLIFFYHWILTYIYDLRPNRITWSHCRISCIAWRRLISFDFHNYDREGDGYVMSEVTSHSWHCHDSPWPVRAADVNRTDTWALYYSQPTPASLCRLFLPPLLASSGPGWFLPEKTLSRYLTHLQCQINVRFLPEAGNQLGMFSSPCSCWLSFFMRELIGFSCSISLARQTARAGLGTPLRNFEYILFQLGGCWRKDAAVLGI